MKVSVAHARGAKGSWYHLDLPEPVTVLTAIRASPLLSQYPDLDPTIHKMGVFGKVCSGETICKKAIVLKFICQFSELLMTMKMMTIK